MPANGRWDLTQHLEG